MASETHIIIIEKMCERWNTSPEVKLFTYNTQYNEDIKSWYSIFNTEFHIQESANGWENLFSNCVSKIENEYDFIFLFRIDLIFKFDFIDLIKRDKINYSMVCFFNHPKYKNCHKTGGGLHRVADMMLYVPGNLMHLLISGKLKLNHDSFSNLGDAYRDNATFILDTYHDSDSQKDRNPIYRIANRPECEIWHSKGYMLGDNPIPDENKTYEKVFINENTLMQNRDNKI